MYKILVVEDAVAIQEFLEMSLSDEGYQPLLVSNGHEALAAVQHHQPDLILLDLWMPGMDGKTFLSHYHALPILLVPVIVMSAVSEIQRDTLLVNSVADCLAKPFDLNRMLGCIKKHLSPVA